MVAQLIEVVKYGSALGFSVAIGMMMFAVSVGGVMLAVLVLIRKLSDWDYKKNKDKYGKAVK